MKSELFSILSKFTPNEIKQLKSFLDNPHFSHNKNLPLLFRNLMKYYPSFEITEEDKIKIFKTIYGNVKYNDSSIRSLMHLLMLRIEDFIAIEYALTELKNKPGVPLGKPVRTDNNTRSISYLKFLAKGDINITFNKTFNRIEKSLTSQFPFISMVSLFTLYEIETIKYNYNSANNHFLHKKDVVSKIGSFLKSNQYLTLYYFIEQVSDYVNQIIIHQKYEVDSSELINPKTILNIEKLEVLFKQNELFEAFNVYMLLYKMFDKIDDDSHYFKYSSLVDKYLSKMSKEDAAFHVSILISYCFIKNNSENNNKFSKELWRLYGVILENELYVNSRSQYLNIWLYRSILFLGLKLGLFDKVKLIIDKYSGKVKQTELKNQSSVNNIHKFSYAFYYYGTGQLELSLEQIKYVKSTNFILKYDIKNLLIKIYYDLKCYDILQSLIKSYNEFLNNDKILNNNLKEQCQNFIYFIEKLVNYSKKYDVYEIKFDRNELLKKNTVYEKDWLLERYSALLQNKSHSEKVSTQT